MDRDVRDGARVLRLGAAFVVGIAAYLVVAAFSCEVRDGREAPRPSGITASANRRPDIARLAVDGNINTRWDTGKIQTGGEWLLLDLGEPHQIMGLTLDTSPSVSDHPMGIKIEISFDKKEFRTAFRQDSTLPKPIQHFALPAPEQGRYIRITQTGKSTNWWWSVHEVTLDLRPLTPLLTGKARWLNLLLLLFCTAMGVALFLLTRLLTRREIITPVRVLVTLCWIFLGLMLAAPHLPEEIAWGYFWIGNFSPWVRVVAFALLLALSLPRLNRTVRRIFSAAVESLAHLTKRYGILLLCTCLFFISWWLASKTIYGDGGETMSLLKAGQRINWREPLDRYFTARMYHFTHTLFGWGPRAAIAMVSCLAGIVYWMTAAALARLLGTSREDRTVIFLLLISMGAVQIFFGNIENYSLLGAGSMLYLYLGLRYLERGTGLVWACLALAVTSCIHLAAVWLLPTLPLLAISGAFRFSHDETGYSFMISRVRLRRLLLESGIGMLGVLLVFGGTFLLAIHHLDSWRNLSIAWFGGGDGRLWVPLFHPSTRFESFTMFSWEHLRALMNELLLICPIGLFLVVAYLLFSPGRVRRCDRQILFLGSCTLLYLAYMSLFNPDMAVFAHPGILNEWDLFSVAAFPLVLLGTYLWARWEPDSWQKRYVSVLLVVLGAIHASAWILSNAKMTF